jgi:AAA domain
MSDINTSSLKAAGFTLASGERIFRMIVVARGQDGRGKTHFALTAPDPLCHIAFDIGGLEGMREKFVSGQVTGKPKIIHQILINKPRPAAKRKAAEGDREAAKKLAAEQWERLDTAYTAAIESGVRTVVIDQETDMWELARLMRFGTDSNVQHLYTELNSFYTEFLNRVFHHPTVNVILIQKLKKQYVGGKNAKGESVDAWNGKWEPSGFGNLRFVAQVTVDCYRDEDEPYEFHLKVDKCRQNPLCTGVVMDGEQISFGSLGEMVFPESTAMDWE